MKKVSTILLIVLAVLVLASWQYRLLCVLLCVLINRKWLRERFSVRCYRIACWVLVVGIYCAIPNYFQRGRTQLHYITEKGEYRHAPIPVYIANALMPEKEVCNFGIKAVALFGAKSGGVGGLLQDAHDDFWRGRMLGFYAPYNNWSHPGSFAYGQMWNQMTNSNYDAIYITRPKGYEKDRQYPVVFFCHGYLGSWELYQGVLDKLDGCIVVSIGTRDLSGIFTSNDLRRIFDKYIPYLQQEGYLVDIDHLHLIGLSNGGSAADAALRNYSNRFQSITYLSTPCNVVKHSKAKVLMICGGKDRGGFGLSVAKRRLESCGTRCAMLYDENENHYMMVRKQKDVVDFLIKEMGLD